MNKLHLIPIAALGALLLTGCAKSGLETSPESLSSIPASEQAIGFSTYTGRAVTKSTDLNQSFSVEAFLSGADTRTLYFHPTAYTYSSGSYTGDTVRYWPLNKTQNLDFYAVSPLKYVKCTNSTDSTEVDLKPSVDSTITLTNTAGTTDVVAARVLNASNGDTPDAVSLTFGHKLTKVAFTAVGQEQDKKYVISGLTLTANSTSTYSYAKATSPVTAESWSASSDGYTYDYAGSDVTIAAGTSTSQAVGSAKYLIPNQASTLTATVSYKIYETSGGTDVCIGDNSAGISVSLPTESWGINRSVVYNLKLGVTASPSAAGKAITFTTDVADWDTEVGIDTKPVTSITLSSTALDLQVGGTSTLTATVAPTDASIKSVFWSSDATGVATVDKDGKVTAVGAGTATITATAVDGSGVTGTCTVTVTAAAATTGTAKATINGQEVDVDWVQLWKDGPKFAVKNVGASAYTDLGSAMSFTDAAKTGSDYVWGSNWKTPSKDEMDLLNTAKVTCTYCQESGVLGFKFTGVQEGYTGNSLFLPADCVDSDYGSAVYWSSTADGSSAWYLYLYYNYGDYYSVWLSCDQSDECCVRPVLSN